MMKKYTYRLDRNTKRMLARKSNDEARMIFVHKGTKRVEIVMDDDTVERLFGINIMALPPYEVMTDEVVS